MDLEKEKIVTIPNIISFARILLVVPIVIAFQQRHFVGVAILLLISGLSDMVDGLIARKLNQVSELGKILDPIADKLTLVAIGLCLALYISAIAPFIIILVVKDVLMLIGGFILLKSGIQPPAAKWYGKVSTVVFYISVVVLVGLDAFMEYENFTLTMTLLAITTVSMVYSFVRYCIISFRLFREKKQSELKLVSKGTKRS